MKANPPDITAYDPVTSAEGALDPLGLYCIVDALGGRMVPGVRERQTHLRLFTGWAVCLPRRR